MLEQIKRALFQDDPEWAAAYNKQLKALSREETVMMMTRLDTVFWSLTAEGVRPVESSVSSNNWNIVFLEGIWFFFAANSCKHCGSTQSTLCFMFNHPQTKVRIFILRYPRPPIWPPPIWLIGLCDKTSQFWQGRKRTQKTSKSVRFENFRFCRTRKKSWPIQLSTKNHQSLILK